MLPAFWAASRISLTVRALSLGTTYLGRNPSSIWMPRSRLGRSRTWPMEALTSYLEPRMREIVLALAGDSTTTRLLLFLVAIVTSPRRRAHGRRRRLVRGHRTWGPTALSDLSVPSLPGRC